MLTFDRKAFVPVEQLLDRASVYTGARGGKRPIRRYCEGWALWCMLWEGKEDYKRWWEPCLFETDRAPTSHRRGFLKYSFALFIPPEVNLLLDGQCSPVPWEVAEPGMHFTPYKLTPTPPEEYVPVICPMPDCNGEITVRKRSKATWFAQCPVCRLTGERASDEGSAVHMLRIEARHQIDYMARKEGLTFL